MQKEYDAIMTNMVKLLEVQQKRELVAVDMIAAAIAAEREAIAKMVEPWLLPSTWRKFEQGASHERQQKVHTTSD